MVGSAVFSGGAAGGMDQRRGNGGGGGQLTGQNPSGAQRRPYHGHFPDSGGTCGMDPFGRGIDGLSAVGGGTADALGRVGHLRVAPGAAVRGLAPGGAGKFHSGAAPMGLQVVGSGGTDIDNFRTNF